MVSRQTAMRWDRARQDGGMEGLRRAPHFGRPERLSAAQRQELVRLLKEGALSAGFPTELWTLPRIAQLIEARFAVKMVASSVWRLLGRLGWSVQRPAGVPADPGATLTPDMRVKYDSVKDVTKAALEFGIVCESIE
jgi:transposase